MKKYILKLELLSPAIIGSGQGFGAVIDTDIVFDEVGIPYIPAKRIKGCLLDSLNAVCDMFKCAGIKDSDIQVNKIFGKKGNQSSAPVYFSNLFIENYHENKAWLEYYLASKKYNNILSKDSILGTFTEIRQQTAVAEDGVAHDNSLRTSRVARKGLVFYGDVFIEDEHLSVIEHISLGCMNFRYMGTQRNRGFGNVRCLLLDGDKKISIQNKLEELCIN